MDVVNDEALLNDLLDRYDIRSHFDSRDIRFRLFHYQKGELHIRQDEEVTDILFLLEGTIAIYGIHENASIMPVSIHQPPVVLGDVEFCGDRTSVNFVQAKSEVYCAALSLARYEEALRRDASFLYYLLQSVTGKFTAGSMLDLQNVSLRDRVLFYLRTVAEDHRLSGVDDATFLLHCSRRQLLRVLRELCDAGLVRKVGRGAYELAPTGLTS